VAKNKASQRAIPEYLIGVVSAGKNIEYVKIMPYTRSHRQVPRTSRDFKVAGEAIGSPKSTTHFKVLAHKEKSRIGGLHKVRIG
jgi:hypothetical protein